MSTMQHAAEPCTSCGTTGGYVPPRHNRPSRNRGCCGACYCRKYHNHTLPDDWPTAAPRGMAIQHCLECGAQDATSTAMWLLGRCPDCHARLRALPPAVDPHAPHLRQYPTEPVMSCAPPLPAHSWRTAVWVRPPRDPLARRLYAREAGEVAA